MDGLLRKLEGRRPCLTAPRLSTRVESAVPGATGDFHAHADHDGVSQHTGGSTQVLQVRLQAGPRGDAKFVEEFNVCFPVGTARKELGHRVSHAHDICIARRQETAIHQPGDKIGSDRFVTDQSPREAGIVPHEKSQTLQIFFIARAFS